MSELHFPSALLRDFDVNLRRSEKRHSETGLGLPVRSGTGSVRLNSHGSSA